MEAVIGRYAIYALIAIAALGTAFVKGIEWEQGREATRLLEEERGFSKRLVERAVEDRKLAAEAAKKLAAEQQARADEQRDFERKLANVPRETLVVVRWRDRPDQQTPPGAPPAAPRVGVALSAVACRLWNDALGAGNTPAERAGRVPRDDPCADPPADKGR